MVSCARSVYSMRLSVMPRRYSRSPEEYANARCAVCMREIVCGRCVFGRNNTAWARCEVMESGWSQGRLAFARLVTLARETAPRASCLGARHVAGQQQSAREMAAPLMISGAQV